MATQLKPPIPEKPYFPSAGLNSDAQGLSIEAEECSDILNMRISRREVFTRSGVRRLAKNSLGSNPALEMFNYKYPSDVETVFAFTKNCIYKLYANDWLYAVKSSEKEPCSSLTDYDTDYGQPNLSLSTNHQFGTSSVKMGGITKDLLNNYIICKYNLNLDFSAYTDIVFWYAHTSTEDLSLTMNFYSNTNCTGLIEKIPVTLSATNPTSFSDCVLHMTTPASFASVKSFALEVPGALTLPAEWDFYLDSIWAVNMLPNDVEFWHITKCIDQTLGETMVAAGSNPPLFDDSEDDQALRLLYRYSHSDGYFSALTTYRQVSTGDEDTSKTGPAAAGVVTSSSALAAKALSGFANVVAGTFTIYTAELGTLASASGILSTDKYMLIPTDSTLIKAGANSYIMADGSSWSLEFLSDKFNGLKIYVSYTYKITVSYKPRFVWNFHNRLLFGNTYETTYQPWRVRWSDVEDITLWVSTNYADLIDNDTSPIVGGDHLGFYLTIYKGESIVKGSYIGGSSIFTFTTAWKNGTWAGRTVKAFKGRHYLLGKDDVFVWDGNSLESITLNRKANEYGISSVHQYRTRETIFNTFNQNQLLKAFGSIFTPYQEYWLWIPKSGETAPSAAWIYSILLDSWYYFEFTPTNCTGTFHLDSGATIDELIGTIDEQNWRFNDSSFEGTIQSLLIAPNAGECNVMDNKTSSDNGYWDFTGTWVPGTAITSKLITRDFIYSALQQWDRTDRVVFEASGSTVDVGYSGIYSTDLAAFRQIDTIPLTPPYIRRYYFPDCVSTQVRFYFSSTSYLSIRWIQPYAIQTETVNE